MSHPRTEAPPGTTLGNAYAQDARFIISKASSASCAVVISTGSLVTVAENKNGRAGAFEDGKSWCDTPNEIEDRPSIKLRTRRNADQLISSSVLPFVASRIA